MKLFLLPLAISIITSAFGVNDSFGMRTMGSNSNQTRISTTENVYRGNNYSASVYLTANEEISALSISVYYDSNAFAIMQKYNTATCNMYDSSIHENYISFTYIFDSISVSAEQRLFYFTYQVKNDAAAGSYCFDVLVEEAYNSSLENVDVEGTMQTVQLVVNSSPKSAQVTINGKKTVNTKINGEFTINYCLSTLDAAGGTFIIHYNDELFEFVTLQEQNFFLDKIVDYNTNTAGEIYCSFISNYSSNNNTQGSNLFNITFKTIANRNISSSITISCTNIYDYDLQSMNFSANTMTAKITYDATFAETPKMLSSFDIDVSNHLVNILINLEEQSHLGAGDFTLFFDKEVFTYLGYEKKINPTFFTVNDKEQQINEGKIKFSILSTMDIVNSTEIISFSFSYLEINHPLYSYIGLEGEGLTNSLTNPISLEVQGVYVLFEGDDVIFAWGNQYLYMNDSSFDGIGTGRCYSDNLYIIAKRELLKLNEQYIDDFSNDINNKYTSILDRYLAWATACGDTSPFEGEGIIQSNSLNVFKQENNYILFICVLTSSLFGLLALFYIIKRRNSGAHNTK